MNGLQAVILPLYLGFLLYCPNADFAGVIVDGQAAVASAGDLGCGLDCACSRADYDPVCSAAAAGNVTFFNACFAGCSDVVLDGAGGLVTFANCSCAGAAASAAAAAAASSSSFASRGVCDEARCSYAPLAAIVFLQVFFTFAAAMPGLVASLR